MARPRPAALELRDVPPSDLWKSLNAAGRLLSSQVGVVRTVHQGAFRAQDPVSYAMGVGMQDLSRFSEIVNSGKSGGGGERPEVALIATLGEAIERYCMLFYDKSKMIFAPHREVRDDAVDLDLVRYFSRQQIEEGSFPYGYCSEDTPIYWTWAHSLTTGRQRLVPSSQVYLNYRRDEGEGSAGRNASTGLAAGSTLEEAILSGLYEVIERDAFAILWLLRQPGRRVRIDDDELMATLRDRFHYDHPFVDLEVFDITLDIPIPSIFTVMRRPLEFGPALILSSVTRLSPKEAMQKALREMGQSAPYLRFLRHEFRDWEPAPDHSDVRTFDHHFTLYSKRPEMIDEAMEFCTGVEEEIALSEIPDRSTGRALGDIEVCRELIESAGFEVLVVDITTDDIRDLGFHVVRVLVPGLVPLHGDHNRPFLGVPRLREISHKMGWDVDPDTPFNRHPHPFP